MLFNGFFGLVQGTGHDENTNGQKDKSAATGLVGQLRDQAELAGVLNSPYELHLTLLSVEYRWQHMSNWVLYKIIIENLLGN